MELEDVGEINKFIFGALEVVVGPGSSFGERAGRLEFPKLVSLL